MVISNFKIYLLNVSAILVGLSVPSLVFGRAAIGIALGLALILSMIAINHRETWQKIRPYLSKSFITLIAITVLCSAINIPFSLRVDLSWEAWARTWALLASIYYLFFCLRNQTQWVLSSLTLAVGLVCALGLIGVIDISKPLMNGLLLTLPLCAYQCWKKSNILWFALCAFIAIGFIANALMVYSKASVAGLVFISLTVTIIFGLTRLSLKKAALLLSVVTLVILAGLMVWLPDHINSSSTLNQDAATFPVWLVDLHRQLIWTFSVELAEKSPWVGFGLNASNYHPDAQATVGQYFGPRFEGMDQITVAPIMPAHPHNWIVEILVDGGLVALIPVLVCVSLLFYYSIKSYTRTYHPALLAFLAISAGYWGTGLLNFSFWSVWWQAIYFITSALCFVLYIQRDEAAHEP